MNTRHYGAAAGRRPNHPFTPRPLALALRAGLLGLGMALAAAPLTPALAEERVATQKSYAIPAGPLAQSLNRFASEAGLTLSFQPHLVAGKQAPALRGDYSPLQGLQALLSGSGLMAVPNAGGYRLEPGSEDVIQLAPVSVTAKGETGSSAGNITPYTPRATSASAGLPLSIKETPQSVSVFTEQRMNDQHLTTVDEVLGQAPGISVKEYDSARQYYYARGFEVTNVLIDGVPTLFDAGWGTGETHASTAMYERVEVVSGASGLMTGSGNPSAAVNLVRKRADSDTFDASAALGAGSRNNVHGSVDLAAPLNAAKTLRGRLIASHEQQDSFRDIGDSSKSLVYATVEADLTDDTRLTLGASHQTNDNNAPTWGGIPAWHADGSRTDYDRSKTTAADWAYWNTTHRNLFAELTHHISDDWQIDAIVNHGSAIGDSRLLYVYGNPDRTTGEGLFAWTGGNFDTESEYDMLDLAASGTYDLFGRSHDAMFGISHVVRDFIAHSHNATSVAPIGDFNAWDGRDYPEHVWGPEFLYEDRTDTQTALYGSTRLSLTDALRAVVGARITDLAVDRNEAAYNEAYTIEHDRVVTPYFGLLYDFNDTYTGYASYTDIFTPQDERDRHGDSLEPIVGKSYEAGLKAGFLSDRLIASAAVFRIEQDNLAQADGTYSIPGSTEQAYYAADGATSEGYELVVTGSLRPGWDLQMGWTAYEAEDADGAKVNTEQPRKLLKAFTSYRLPGALSKLTVGGGFRWESETYAKVTNPVTSAPERLEQESLTLVHLMANYKLSDKFQVQLNVDNLTDETYYTNIGTFGQIAYGEPRTVTVTGKYDF